MVGQKISGRQIGIVSTANQDSPLMGKAIAGAEGTPFRGRRLGTRYYLNYQTAAPITSKPGERGQIGMRLRRNY